VIIHLKALLLILLSILDSIFTIAIVGQGGIELNPIMGSALEQGNLIFFLIKFTLVVICVTILVTIHNVYKIEEIQKILSFFILVYSGIISWEMYLIIWGM
jgi:peptidoglycan/LPS O-acetylase OafA/YrhL